MFTIWCRYGIRVPNSRFRVEMIQPSRPSYCIYHGTTGHDIFNCRIFKGLVQNRYELGTFGLPARLRRNSNSRNEFTVNVVSCSTDSTDEEYPTISYHSSSTSGESTDSLSKRYTETDSTDIECPVVTRNTDFADEESTNFSTEESLQSRAKSVL
jgi:hypothetical protein